jgi:lipid II:glycine glycyltransferase (peptidoglycan interpeptide bridge formation enzyme)
VDEFLEQYPHAHLLQTSAWGQLKTEFGWQVTRLTSEPYPSPPETLGRRTSPSGAQVLFRPLPLGFTIAYIAKGPVSCMENCQVFEGWEGLWPEVDATCRKRRCVFLKVEPDFWEEEAPGSQPAGFQLSPHTIQPPRTIVLDLTGAEDQVLARMKQKTRYNIRLAIKKGVIVQPSADVNLFFQLILATGDRVRFGVHRLAYYQRTFDLFHNRGECELLLAELAGEPLAALMVFTHGARAWYFYGASVNTHREAMPTYLLQ